MNRIGSEQHLAHFAHGIARGITDAVDILRAAKFGKQVGDVAGFSRPQTQALVIAWRTTSWNSWRKEFSSGIEVHLQGGLGFCSLLGWGAGTLRNRVYYLCMTRRLSDLLQITNR